MQRRVRLTHQQQRCHFALLLLLAWYAVRGPVLVGRPVLSSTDDLLLGASHAGGVEVWRRAGDKLFVRGGVKTLCNRGYIYLLSLRYSYNSSLRPPYRTRYFKIGGTKDMARRLPAYITSQPFRPEVINVTSVPDWFASERRILDSFERCKALDGGKEWRSLSDEELQRALKLMEAEAKQWESLEEEEVPLQLALQVLQQPPISVDSWPEAPTGMAHTFGASLESLHDMAVTAVLQQFGPQNIPRATVVMPEGTGIEAVGMKVVRALRNLGTDTKRVLVLNAQIERIVAAWDVWKTNMKDAKFLVLASSKYKPELSRAGIAHISYQRTNAIKEFLSSGNSSTCSVVMCLYSTWMTVLKENQGLKELTSEFDLTVYHDPLPSSKSSVKSTQIKDAKVELLLDSVVPSSRRLFLTPMINFISQAGTVDWSMENQELYGPVVLRLARSEAVRLGYLSPARLLLTDKIGSHSKEGDLSEIAGATLDCIQKQSLRRVYVFHRDAKDMNLQLAATARRIGMRVSSTYVSGWTTADEREEQLAKLDDSLPAIVSNPFLLALNRSQEADMAVLAGGLRNNLILSKVVDLVSKPSPGRNQGLIMIPIVQKQGLAQAALLRILMALAADDPPILEAMKRLVQRFVLTGQLVLPREWPEEIQDLFSPNPELPIEMILDAVSEATKRLITPWDFNTALLRAFRLREGHAEVPKDQIEAGVGLGCWLAEQRSAAQAGQLNGEQFKLLESLGVKFGNSQTAAVRDAEFERRYEQLLAFRAREGDCDVESLSRWVQRQRSKVKRGSLKVGQKRRLEALGLELELPDREERWKEHWKALESFKMREGHADVPSSHVENGLKLGAWVDAQRARHKDGHLTSTRVAKLSDLGLRLMQRSLQWDDYLQVLEAFVKREGHADVPAKHVEGNLGLGSWLESQRKLHFHAGIEPKRCRRLEQLGVELDVDDARFKRNCRALSSFKRREGHMKVPRKHEELGTLNLGTWLYSQKSKAKEGKLSRDERQQLEKLGVELPEAVKAPK